MALIVEPDAVITEPRTVVYHQSRSKNATMVMTHDQAARKEPCQLRTNETESGSTYLQLRVSATPRHSGEDLQHKLYTADNDVLSH
jgi:hypothetical protein